MRRVAMMLTMMFATTAMLAPPAMAQTADVVPVVEKTYSPNPGVVGQPLTFHITLTINGSPTANDVTLGDVLLPNMDFVSATATAADGSDVSGNCHVDDPTPTTPNGAVGCDVGDVPGGDSVSMDLTVIPREAGTYQNWACSGFWLPPGTTSDPSRNCDEVNVVVVDSPEEPPGPEKPTSKEQCKNGGYATFGYKNQGQCIKAVNRTS